MTTQTNAKIRLVRCPKCKQLLQEPEIPVYRCGGCGAVLQAKNRKTDGKGKGLKSNGSDANGNGEVDNVLDEREINGPSQEAIISARGDSLPDSDCKRNQGNGPNQETTITERGEPLPDAGSNGNQDNCLNQEISARGECLPDADSNKNQDICLNQEISAREDCLPDTGSDRIQDICLNQEITVSSGEETSPDASNNRSDNNSRDCNGKQPGAENFPPEPPSSLELCSHENEELLVDYNGKQPGAGNFPPEPPSSLELCSHENEELPVDYNGKQPGAKNSPPEPPSSLELCSREIEELPVDYNGKQPGAKNSPPEPPSSLELCSREIEELPVDYNGKQPGAKNFPPELPSSLDLCCHEDEELPVDYNGKQPGAKNSPPEPPSSLELCSREIEELPVDYNGKQPGAKNFPPELPSSLELCSHEDEELPVEITEQTQEVHCEYNAGQNMQDYENESGDSDRNGISGRSFSDDFYSSVEFPCHEAEDSSPELVANMALGETTTTSDQWAKMDQTVSENCVREQHEYNNFLSQVSSPNEEKKHNENDFSSKSGTLTEGGDNIHLSQHYVSTNECKFEDHRREIPQNANSPKEIPSSTDIVPPILSSVVHANTEVDEDSGAHNFDNLETEGTLAKEETGSIEADENPLDGSIISVNVDSSDDQHRGASPSLISQGIRQRCISDTPDSLLLGNSGLEFGLKHRELFKSPTKCYYGHDGSASSYDDDRIPGRLAKPPRRRARHANLNNSNGLYIEDGPRANDLLSGNLEMQYQPILGPGLNEFLNNESDARHQARKPMILPEKNHFTLKYRNKQDDLHDPRSFGRSNGSKMREDREEHISGLPFSPIYPQTGQRKASPPPYPLNTFQHYSSLYSSDAPSYTEPGKMELLRMVNELKDELNRMHISTGRFRPRLSREGKYTPLYCDHYPATVEEPSSDLSYSRYPRRYSQEKGLPQLYQPPRMAFSGDAADYRRHVDYPCPHCHPQDLHYSVQLPSHTICCNTVHCMGHSSTCYNPCSTSSSPHRYNTSEFSVWDCDTISVDQRHRDNGMRNLHLRERYQSFKKHVRPVAGGNPIIACYHCSELLQLPADFLLMGKRRHKLRCNTCEKVMKFSLRRSKHLVPSIPDAVAPPPSVVDDCSGSIPQGNWVSAAHSSDNQDAEPLSCTDDYGVSFERSISTEGEAPVMSPPFQPVERNSRNRKMSPCDSGMILEDRKMKSVLGEHQKMAIKSAENLGKVGPLSKRSKGRKSSSEIKELPQTEGSPLHRLMGYSSPSAVMRN